MQTSKDIDWYGIALEEINAMNAPAKQGEKELVFSQSPNLLDALSIDEIDNISNITLYEIEKRMRPLLKQVQHKCKYKDYRTSTAIIFKLLYGEIPSNRSRESFAVGRILRYYCPNKAYTSHIDNKIYKSVFKFPKNWRLKKMPLSLKLRRELQDDK